MLLAQKVMQLEIIRLRKHVSQAQKDKHHAFSSLWILFL